MRDHAVHGLHDDDHDVQRNGECKSTPVARDGGMVVTMAVSMAVARMCVRIVVVVRVRFMVVIMVMVMSMIIAVVRGMSAMSTPLRRRFLVAENGSVLVIALFGGTLWFAIVAHQTDS
jgi:hypothetical protein